MKIVVLIPQQPNNQRKQEAKSPTTALLKPWSGFLEPKCRGFGDQNEAIDSLDKMEGTHTLDGSEIPNNHLGWC